MEQLQKHYEEEEKKTKKKKYIEAVEELKKLFKYGTFKDIDEMMEREYTFRDKDFNK